MRDNFTKSTIEILAKRAGYLCSNPSCRNHTIGSNLNNEKSTSIGIAAHITGASPGGARYDDSFSNEERGHIDNGIWLCANCSNLIDKDDNRYPVELLKDWKKTAELESSLRLSGQIKYQQVGFPYIEADLIWSWGGRFNKGYAPVKPLYFVNDNEPVYGFSENRIIYWELYWRFKFTIYNNSTYPAYNVSIESIGKKHFSYLTKLEKLNNIPPLQNSDLEAKYSLYFTGNSEEAEKISREKIPNIFNDLVLKISYLDEQRNKHITIVEFKNGQVLNTKA